MPSEKLYDLPQSNPSILILYSSEQVQFNWPKSVPKAIEAYSQGSLYINEF